MAPITFAPPSATLGAIQHSEQTLGAEPKGLHQSQAIPITVNDLLKNPITWRRSEWALIIPGFDEQMVVFWGLWLQPLVYF